MPVTSLTDPAHIVTIADEIEAFFNVLLHYAIRYLRHSIERWVKAFIEYYFLSSHNVEGIRSCGPGKANLIKRGSFSYGGADITFESEPLDKIFQDLLLLFKARYQVLDYEASKNVAAAAAISTSGPGSAATPAPNHPVAPSVRLPPRGPVGIDLEKLRQSLTNERASQASNQAATKAQAVAEPSEEVKERANRLDTHTAVREMLWKLTLLCEDDWPTVELKTDYLERAHTPPPDVMAIVSGTISDLTGDGTDGIHQSLEVAVYNRPEPARPTKKSKKFF